ncbi:phosphotransferase family protein [Kitasatospora sp. NPDC088783]|uniref:phosphotransferase family protein n=1 Tax=Kitasatospora sp. NPDC088783 TaxID=3364077 RepID=UPI00382858BA
MTSSTSTTPAPKLSTARAPLPGAGPVRTHGHGGGAQQHPAAQARAALAAAAARQGFNAGGAHLLQEGLNWVYRLPAAGVIGKVHGRASYDQADRQLRAARALLAAGILTAAPAGPVPHPIIAGQAVVTFTEDLGTDRATSCHLGELLARLHRLPSLPGVELPAADRSGHLAARIDALAPQAVTDRQRAQLRECLERAAAEYARTDWPAPCVVHGDVSPSNTVLTPRGAALIDLESLAVGNPCTDQAMPAWATGAFDLPTAYNRRFVAGYGYDIASAAPHRYRALVPLLSLGPLLTYLELSVSRPDVRSEAERRLETILDGRPQPWGWKIPALVTAPAAGGAR